MYKASFFSVSGNPVRNEPWIVPGLLLVLQPAAVGEGRIVDTADTDNRGGGVVGGAVDGHNRLHDGHGLDNGHMSHHGHVTHHIHLTNNGHGGVAGAIDGTALTQSQAGGEQQAGEEELKRKRGLEFRSRHCWCC